MRPLSLKSRVALLASALVGALWIATVVGTWFEAREEAEELFDAHLAQAASLLVALTRESVGADEAQELDEQHAPLLHRYARRVAFQIWMGGRLQLHSANAPSMPMSTRHDGFSDSVIDGERWRVFSAWDEAQRIQVQVGERTLAREELTRSVAAGLLKPLLIALPIIALLIWLAVRQGIRPLDRIAAEVEQRSPERLARLPTEGLPGEVLPLVERLNSLLERVAHSLQQERRFTADAAHELRTPLAGLRAQAQVALGAREEGERAHALAHLVTGCDRMTHLVEQLLLLARVDAARPGDFSRTDFAAIVRQVLADKAPRALDQHIELELLGIERLDLPCNAAWLGMLVRNLVDNALRHAGTPGKVCLQLTADAHTACLEIADSGPGLPAEALPHLGQRFWRFSGHPQAAAVQAGSGLGLSIARRIVELHGGDIHFRKGTAEGLQGLHVSVRLPLHQPDIHEPS